MHTGIYYSIAAKYSRAYPDVIKIDDLNDDRMTNIYKWIIDYNPEKNMKLSSYIGDMTKYLCMDILKKEKHNPLSPSVITPRFETEQSNGTIVAAHIEDVEQDVHSTNGMATVMLSDNTTSARPADEANTLVGVTDIMKVVESLNGELDPRFKSILEYRHFTKPSLTWRAIGGKIGLSHEMTRRIYNRNMEKVKEKMGAGV